MQNDYSNLEKTIGYVFKDKSLLQLAFTHPSYANENSLNKYETNQRLEYLGDAVLELIVSDFLYDKYTSYEEGKLTKIRAKLVCEENLCIIGRNLELYKYLITGKGENEEKLKNNSSIMCDTIEALIGAMYKDSDLDTCTKFINTFILTDENLNKTNSDFKSILQEFANKSSDSVKYVLADEKGPDHLKEFFVNVYYNNKIIGSGSGKSKKDAEQNAAQSALIKLLSI